jgi:hypothetical protein
MIQDDNGLNKRGFLYNGNGDAAKGRSTKLRILSLIDGENLVR